jgi:anaerobic selenocysteine-containing dehydrogenase
MADHRIEDLWGGRSPYGGEPWPVRVDGRYEEGIGPEDVERWVPTASLLHSKGDAMDIAFAQGRMVGVHGRAADRVNRGRLDINVLHAWTAGRSHDRLRAPLIRRNRQLMETDWDTVMAAVASARLILLEDLRAVHLLATGASLDWDMLAQLAQVLREELLDLTAAAHEQTLRQIAWATTMLRAASPQVLASA